MFDMGRLNKQTHPAKKKAAKTYQDSRGQSRFTGGNEMKASQQLGLQTDTRHVIVVRKASSCSSAKDLSGPLCQQSLAIAHDIAEGEA